MSDMLTEAFERQHQLLAALVANGRSEGTPAEPWNCIHRRQDGQLLCKQCTNSALYNVQLYAEALQMEAAELKDWTPWKHWSSRLGNKADVTIGSERHWDEIHIELADQYCFLIDACISAGMTAADLDAVHRRKTEVNHQRQESGSY